MRAWATLRPLAQGNGHTSCPCVTCWTATGSLIASAYDRKIADLRENASISYCVDAYSEDWDNALAQVIVFGEAYLVESGPEFERDRNLLYEKFPQYERVAPIEEGTTAIIEFRVDRVHSNGV